jgi:hypothetical protein
VQIPVYGWVGAWASVAGSAIRLELDRVDLDEEETELEIS